jgi:hypothetical protein
MNAHTIRFAVALCSLGAALPALAGDVRAQLTPDLVYSHCYTAGVGSEKEGTFMLASGRVTGTVLCTAEDLAAPKMSASARRGDDDDNDDSHGRHHEDDNDDCREDDDRDD